MKKIIFCLISSTIMFSVMADPLEKDVIKTAAGDLTITFIGHGSLLFNYKNKNIYVDPFSKLTDYAKLPKADLVFLTHDHHDHLDPEALNLVSRDHTKVVGNADCAKTVKQAEIMKNGEEKTVDGIKVEAVPAYNIIHKRNSGEPFHPPGKGNGYIFTFGDKRVYVAGDTENTPEMKALKNIDIAFLPMNLPYTMTPAMVADAATAFSPKILYPYHFGETDTSKLVLLLKNNKNIDVRIRKMK